MQTRSLRTAVAAVIGAGLLAGSAVAQDTQSFDLSGFRGVDAGGGYNIVVTQGDAYSVVLEGDAEDFEDIELRVRRDELKVDQDTHWFSRRRWLDVTVRVTLPDIDSLEFSRGIEAQAFEIDSDNLELDVSTGAEVELSGRCGMLDLDGSTGALLDAGDLVCANVSIDSSTGAELRVHATESITASASTGAEVRVSGAPPNHELRSSMGGSVRLDRNG